MPIVLNENATNVNLLISITDDDGNGITNIAHDDEDLTISYFSESASEWVSLSLVPGVLGAWTSNGFIELPNSEGEYLLGLPNAAVSARKSIMIRVNYGNNKPLRDIVNFVGPPNFPNNFANMQINQDGKLNLNITSLRLMLQIPSIATSLMSNFRVFVKETGRTVTFTANENIESVDLQFVFEDVDGLDLAIVEGEDLSVVGNTVSLVLPSTVTDDVRRVRWAARNAVDGTLYGQDEFSVEYAPYQDEPNA